VNDSYTDEVNERLAPLVREMLLNSPYLPIDTGELRDSMEVVGNPSGLGVVLGFTSEYAPYVDQGVHEDYPEYMLLEIESVIADMAKEIILEILEEKYSGAK